MGGNDLNIVYSCMELSNNENYIKGEYIAIHFKLYNGIIIILGEIMGT